MHRLLRISAMARLSDSAKVVWKEAYAEQVEAGFARCALPLFWHVRA